MMTILNLRLALGLPMRCERLFVFSLLIVVACSKETPAPPETPVAPANTATSSTSAPARVVSYEEAMVWFRATPGFRFELTENGVRAEGEMRRKTVGAETLAVKVNGEEWRAESGTKGVTWTRNGAAAETPEWGNRVYQRVTVAFDPQKVEGAAQLVGDHYRFTNANTGEVHDVYVAPDGHITRITIGNTMDLKIEPLS